MWVFFIANLMIFIILSSKIKVEIKEDLIDSFTKFKDIKYRISLKLFNIVKLVSFEFSKNKLGRKVNILKPGYRNALKLIKYVLNKRKIKVEKLKINLELGTEDAALTAYATASISTIVFLFIRRQIKFIPKDKYEIKIIPVFSNRNLFNLSINCIVSINFVHIIYMIYVLLRKDDEENGRTSNRRAYDSSNEQYTRYGRCRYYNR